MADSDAHPLTVVGMLSGTSVDAVDVAAASFGFGADGVLTLTPLGHREHPWPARLRDRVLAVSPPALVPLAEVCALDNEIGQVFASVAAAAVADFTGGRAELVASLGQTVFHDVRAGRCHGTLQLGQPAWIAQATGLPVVSDLRAADVAAGGQGAPLASTLDALWLGAARGTAVALNLGGIANVTVVRADAPVLAFDTGPANCLLDLAADRLSDGALRCDVDGALAGAGTVRADLLAALLDEPYFDLTPPRSCGRELFDLGYLDRALAAVPVVAGADLMATLTEFTAVTVTRALAGYRPGEIVVSGGGLRNPVLMAALRRGLPAADWCTSTERGLPSEAKEAYLVALLGALTWQGLPGTVAGATGAHRPTILGRITPARRAAVVAAPTVLRLAVP